MGKTKYFFFFVLLGIFSIFFWSQKAKAAGEPTQEVVINEVMANPSGVDTDHEWLEISNFGSDSINLQNWQLQIYGTDTITIKKTIHFDSVILNQGDYLVVVSNDLVFRPCASCLIYDGKFGSTSITNDSGKLSLENNSGYTYDFLWKIEDKVEEGDSMEVYGPPLDPTFSQWGESIISGGTPGAKNSVSEIQKPHSPTLVSPTLGEKFNGSQNIDFEWSSGDTNISYEFLLGDDIAISNPIIDEVGLIDMEYIAEDLEVGKYYWQVIATNGVDEAVSEIYNFEILPIVYSDAIIINELYPDPASGEEWIELFNNSNEAVNLKNWILEDLKGSTRQYKIDSDLIINPYGYIAIDRTESGITLNNDQDGVRVIRPDGIVLYESPIFNSGEKGWSFAKNPAGNWEWTASITKLALNIIYLPPEEEVTIKDEEGDEDIPKNSDPIDIKTGDFRNYEDYLVKITGVVTETSGNTFYLDDGTGEAKVYIQESKDIDKPPMHVGDIFEILGIVNFYRNSWRILPQKQDDIKLVKALQKADAESTTSTKKTTTKSSTASVKSTASTAKARSPTSSSGQVASANDINTQVKSAQTPFWIQMTKAVTGLAIVFLVILIIKIREIRKTKPEPLGGHFGDDFT